VLLRHARLDVDGDVLVRHVLVGERDAHAPRRRRAPVVVELHACTTFCAMRPNTLVPSGARISISTVSPAFMNGVSGLPFSMVSIMRRSARHEMPRARSGFDTVP